MKLSIIIVNYNVKHFLNQCLQSVVDAMEQMDAEIIVVDNNSQDDSQALIKENFPEVIWIQNDKNVGFGVANNQGLAIAKGQYCLLLNPDTILQADTLKKSVGFMDQHQDAGSLGIKMIDGSGQFLPESKRSFPSPEVAFYKLFGLAKLFPKNERFGQYHLTYLDKDENHPVDVLSGAFFLIRTSLFKKIGGFDEDFFMYGEDIDLSYRVQQEGFKNYYFAESSIIHYKGESTKNKSVNYIKHFYQAMVIFSRKHYKSRKQSVFIFIMNLAIAFRGVIALLSSFIKSIGLPLLDAAIAFALMHFSKEIWLALKTDIRDYLPNIYYVNFPIYIVLSLIAMYFSGAYDRPYKLSNIFRGSIYSILLISIVYAFLPEQNRFSRAMIVFTGICIALALMLNRMVIQQYRHGSFSFYRSKKRSFLVLGDVESLKIKDILLEESSFYSFLGLVTNQNVSHPEKIGGVHQLKDIFKQLRPTEIIVDTRVISYTKLVQLLEKFGSKTRRFHTTSDLGKTIISSHDSNYAGDIYDENMRYRIALPSEKRKKRMLDLAVSTLLVLLSPILVWFQRNKLHYFNNIFQVFIGKKTWVGYSNGHIEALPPIKSGVLSTNGLRQKQFHTAEIETQLNQRYAKNYSVYEDIDIILMNWSRLS